MILHKQLKWIGPYLEDVAHMVPLEKVCRINLLFYKGKRPPYVGLCTAWTDQTYSILVKMPDTIKNEVPLAPWAQEEILCHLAHELAHLAHWDHTRERFLLEALIYHQFAVTLNRLGYEEERNRVK